MRTRRIVFTLATLALALFSCTLPGATPPTPFVFPTPNQTLTAIFAPTEVTTPAPPPTSEALPTVAVTPAETISVLPTVTSVGLSRPNGTPLEATFLATPPVIDGDLGEWSTSAYGVTQIVYGASRWSGLGDASGVVYVGWDDSHLYLAARVTDDRYIQVSKGESLFLGDGLEIQLDSNLAGDFYLANVDGDDYQIGLSAGNFGSIPPQAHLWYPSSKSGVPSGVTVAGKSSSSGYTLEASVPWSVVGVTAVEGGRFGFVISVSDNDAAGVAAQQSMVSSVSTRTLFNPTTWGMLVLEGPSGGS